MTTRRFSYLLALLMMGGAATHVQAGWNEFVQRSMLDWQRNNTWPQPFVHSDRLATCAPFMVMMENGRCGEFTLGEYHFDPMTQSLTEAGQRKVADIVRRQPNTSPQVFLVRGLDSEQSAVRLDAVQQAVTKAIPEGPLPDVRFVEYGPQGATAAYIDAIGRKLDASTPPPRLPQFTTTTK